jgi:hypothetical protein
MSGTGSSSQDWTFPDLGISSPVDETPATASSSEVMGLAVLLT